MADITQMKLIVRCAVAFVVAGAMASCSHDVLSQADATSGIDRGTAMNTQTGSYHVRNVDVTLEKVVSLSDGMLGLRFAFDSDLTDCCSLFPRADLSDDPIKETNTPPMTDVVVPAAYVQDGKLVMHLWDRNTSHKSQAFTVDFAALGIQSNA
jgi:hypothetical protein